MQVGVVGLRLRIDQLGLFAGQSDFGPADIQLADGPGGETVALRFQFFLQNADRLFAHANLWPDSGASR